jgi:hypothetical protein
MPTAPRTIAQHHYQQAELTLAALGSLAATSEEATREAAVAPRGSSGGPSTVPATREQHQATSEHWT